MSPPKVSIIIPCYNSEKWISKSVISALGQTYENTEVIVVDNESTDNTLNILEMLKESNSRLIVDTAKNLYPSCWDEPRSKGFKLSTGDYLFTLASDDFYEESYVSNCIAYIGSQPDEILALQSSIKNITDPDEQLLGFAGHTYSSISHFKDLCLRHCPVTSPTVVFKRVLYDDGLLKTKPEKYSGAADYDLYCRLANDNIFIHSAGCYLGYNYRWHPEQATWDMHKDPVNYDKLIQNYWKEKWKR
jgi:glycosyltransferase involved in cell wall biosynthesis